jgi:hypothetical protein
MPAETEIRPLHWNQILNGIRKGLCVPFRGSGVNVSSGNYVGLPLGSEVAMRLTEKMLRIPQHLSSWRELAEVKPLHVSLTKSDYRDLTRVGLQDLARIALHVEFEIDPTC